MKPLRALASLLAVLTLTLALVATPAFASSYLCEDQVSPVALAMNWNTSYNEARARTKAPIPSTAKLYVKEAGDPAYSYVGYGHAPGNYTVTLYFITTSPASYVVLNYPDAGYTWVNPSGTTVAYCRSPIRTLL